MPYEVLFDHRLHYSGPDRVILSEPLSERPRGLPVAVSFPGRE